MATGNGLYIATSTIHNGYHPKQMTQNFNKAGNARLT
jgi:hypothetical protein